MRTNRNFISKLSKVSLIMALAFTTLVSVSCQNAARQSFHYKTDFIKQMVYQVSNEILTGKFITALNQNNNKEAAAKLVNYSISGRTSKHISTNRTNDLTDFLRQAAQLSTPVAEAEAEKDNTLDFLTSAAQLNSPVTEMETEQDNTLDFLTAAAQLNSEVAQDDNSNDGTLELLINAAQLSEPVNSEETDQNDLLDFLTQAAGLNDCVAE
jgi:hypothetical protein